MAISTPQNGKLKFADGDKEKIEKAVDKAMKCIAHVLDDEELTGRILNVGAFESKKEDLEDVVNPIVHAALLRVPYGSW